MATTPEVQSKGSVPVPDPTLLTTQALVSAVTSLREVLEAEMGGQKAVFESRLEGMDKAITLLQVTTDRQPALVDGKIANLKTLHEERFSSIQTQFTERDVRTEQTAKDSKVAVDAAFQAAKEVVEEQNKSRALAIAKSEAATTKQIDQQGLLITTATAGLNDKIDDIKSRLTLIEGRSNGVSMQKDDSRSNVGIIASLGFGVISIIIAVVSILTRHL